MKKKFVIDTSVLIYDIDCLDKFGENEIIIPSIVYEEINVLKDEDSERGYYARQIASRLEALSVTASFKTGIQVGKTLIRTSYEIRNDAISKNLIMKKNDYMIIACAINERATLITRDKMMTIIARDFVNVEAYRADQIKVEEPYKGYRRVVVPSKDIELLYTKRLKNVYGLFPNEFILMVDEENEEHTGIGICKGDKGRNVHPVNFDKMNTKGLRLKLTPQNLEQRMLLYLLQDEDIKCVTVTGPSGKGKSVLSVDFALASVEAALQNQFLFTKSTIAVDTREELGFYPGDLTEKMKPHLQPLFSSIEQLYKQELYKGKERKSVDAKVEELLAKDILKFYPLANIRGMSINEKVVMLDEAQNTTNHMMKTIVTRVCDNSKLIVTGDVDQIDDRNLNKFNNGLTHLIETGKEEEFIGHICMDIAEESKRGKLATFGSKKL